MDSLLRWLVEKPYRATILNIFLLTLVLTLAASPGLFRVVGLLLVMLATAHFIWRAVRVTRHHRGTSNFYGLMLTWLPGLLACGMALGALHLVAEAAVMDWPFLLGALLFGCEIALLLLAAHGYDEQGAVTRAAAE